MTDPIQFGYNDDTVVSSDEKPDSDTWTAGLLALIQREVARDARSRDELALAIGCSRRKFARLIDGRQPMRLPEVNALLAFLGIDRARAFVAIELMGDWQSYDDPHLTIVMRLVEPVVRKINAGAEFLIEPLTAAAENQLSDWLANTIVTNEEQIRNRRNEFANLPRI